AAGVATACKSNSPVQAAVAGGEVMATGGTVGPHDTTAASDAMDAMHEKGIKAFPAKTAGKGNQLLAPRIEKGVKIFEVTAKKIQWEKDQGKFVEAWAYNDQIPGPQIRVKQGDRVRLVLHNELPESPPVLF